MTFKADIKQAEEKLLILGDLVKEDKNSLQEIKDINKELKKIINIAEKEIKYTQNVLKKTCKELKKTKSSHKEEENNELLAKFSQRQKELLFGYNEKTSSTLLELTKKYQEAQKSIKKLKVKEVI